MDGSPPQASNGYCTRPVDGAPRYGSRLSDPGLLAVETPHGRSPGSPVYSHMRQSHVSEGPRYQRLAAVLVIALLVACSPPGVVGAVPPLMPEPPVAQPYARATDVMTEVGADGCHLVDVETVATRTRASLSLVGDPEFDPSALHPEIRCWYEELWSVLLEPSRSAYFTSRADRYDLYTYAREMNTHIGALLTALRITGDLRILDEVDRLAQHMRSQLKDTWAGRAARDEGSKDGYLNWVWDRETSDAHRGRDINEIDEMRTHSMVAQFAYAFSVNEGLASPNGVDYAERAKFWTYYLVDHFEAKWRERHGIPWPEFPFITRPHMHETTEFIRYHHYMYLLTGHDEYRSEAERMTKLVMGNFVEVQTDAGTAYVTPRSVLSMGGSVRYLLPSTYVRYLYATAVDLHLEGVSPWSADDTMERLARSLSEFIMDDGDSDFARDMGGGVSRGGVPATDSSEWFRFSAERYNISPYALLSAWDDSGKVAKVSKSVFAHYRGRQGNVFIPVAMMLDAALN